MQSSRSVVPRGFSKYYVLSLLQEKPMTGKEIMEETAKRTDGAWKPSPGLVYPLLGKLLSSGYVEEVDEGRGYQITKTGQTLLAQYGQRNREIDNLFMTITRLGMYGQLIAKDAVDSVITVMKNLRDDISKLGGSQRAKYRKFLVSEIERLDRADMNGSNSRN
jgi:DNA-binding PadR family transcriptional regulator